MALTRLRRFRGRPVAVACAIAFAYVGWMAWYTRHHSIVTLPHVGQEFQQRPGTSDAIASVRLRADAGAGRLGYDGQFFLYIALDPIGARRNLDVPAYRYARPLYPLAARALALGRRGATPWALLVLGIAGAVAGTWAVARFFELEGLSVWYGALYGAYPGLFRAVSWDLSEALAYGLAALGSLAFGRDGRRVWAATGLFALAGLTRETTLLFPLAFAAWLARRPGRRRDALVLVGGSFAPYVAMKVGLAVWLHSAGAARATHVEPVPFLGLIRQWPWADEDVQQIMAVVAPALLAAFVVLRAIRGLTPAVLALLANVVILVVLLPQPSYDDYLASGRIATGVVLAFLLCLPSLLRQGRYTDAWIVFLLWLLPWYEILPEALRRT